MVLNGEAALLRGWSGENDAYEYGNENRGMVSAGTCIWLRPDIVGDEQRITATMVEPESGKYNSTIPMIEIEEL